MKSKSLIKNEYEVAVIGALLLSDEKEHIERAFGSLTAKFFDVKELSNLFDNFKKQYIAHHKIDTVVAGSLGNEYIPIMQECMEKVPSPHLLPQYVTMLFNSHKINILKKDVKVLTETIEFDADVETVTASLKRLNERQEMFEDVEETCTSLGMVESLIEYYSYLSKGKSEAIETGLRTLDRITGGFQPQSFNVLAGRSGMGKSDLAVTIATNIGARHKVLYLSMEMPRYQILERIVSRATKIDSSKLTAKRLNKDEWVAVAEVTDRLGKLDVIFDEQQNLTIEDIQAKIRKHQPEFIILDHIALMKTDNRRKKWECLQEISLKLKQIAMQTKIPFLILVQQSSDVEKRTDKKGRLSDLKGTDNIGNDADIVLFIRAEKGQGTISDGAWADAFIQVEKNRHGKTGTTELHWQPQYHKYIEIERR